MRNYTRDYSELLSPQARGDTGPRLFNDEDVSTLCTVANLRKEDVPRAEIIERLQRGDIVIDAATSPQQATPSHPQATQTATEAPQALMLVRSDLQRQINEIKRNQTTLIRVAVLWGALWGAIAALALGSFFLYVLWLWPK